MSKVTMSHRNNRQLAKLTLLVTLMSFGTAQALQSDRQQPLEVNAQGTEGSLGDGATVLKGRVEIRQGTLLILADEAEVLKSEGKVARITFSGSPATLEQEIEDQGMVNAQANRIIYQVKAGKVELAGNADVSHPQYKISGDVLTYDLDTQHFEGTGSDSDDGRISIRLEPEVASELQGAEPQETETSDEGGTGSAQDPDN